MKILIYVHKRDVISGNITNYFTHSRPQTSNWPDYVLVEISRDEFVRLEDLKHAKRDSDQWKIDQYNRNRLAEDMIDSVDDIEFNQDDQPFGD
tara:strand:- start:2685 stop:2963 length:279 start_codon:yes stop_codon:yes gene_type:complete